VTVPAREDLALECTIDVMESWDVVTASQELDTRSSVLAVHSSNGSESHSTDGSLTTVTFTRHSSGIRVGFNVKLATANTCPSLLRFKCGITMADNARTVLMNTSNVEITGKLYTDDLPFSSKRENATIPNNDQSRNTSRNYE
jgi:hypothetical protein